jgi:4-hydroxybenzoate polyprenyltransferase
MTLALRFPISHKSGNLEEKWTFAKFAGVGRLHITVIASLGCFTFGWLFIGDYPWLLAGVCALDWFLVNLGNRIADLDEDRANSIAGSGFVYRNRRLLLGLWLVVLFSSLVTVHFLNRAITPLRIAGHLLGLVYNWRLLPRRRRLKQLYFWKNNASGIAFLLTVFGYPLATVGWGKGVHTFPAGITWGTVVFSAAFFFLFELSYEVIYDLRDVRGDALARVRTYPVVHGLRTAEYIVDGLIFSSMAVLVVGYMFDFVPWRIFIMIAAPALQYFVFKRALRRGISSKDCIRVTWMGAALLVTYHLWILLNLPGSRL